MTKVKGMMGRVRGKKWRFERERRRSYCASACAYVCVAGCVRSQAHVSHHVLTGLSGVPGVLHLPLSDHVTRSTNDNITGQINSGCWQIWDGTSLWPACQLTQTHTHVHTVLPIRFLRVKCVYVLGCVCIYICINVCVNVLYICEESALMHMCIFLFFCVIHGILSFLKVYCH